MQDLNVWKGELTVTRINNMLALGKLKGAPDKVLAVTVDWLQDEINKLVELKAKVEAIRLNR